ncbi:crotonobetaine/carnitine-CoA ligase [Mesorhizobium soli]|uniref:AMP-binding protein n=1 Tax=Pseudaminobacter soli (ex Li et al. 2025) TaxID=1295366 RepID=UPI0024772062|nr:AMP-binding protein [Mesorhizobium soli]MDH6235015.1 crotonobetaine/carnitine-CoA ligase [Mesorhizobium soli]
MSKPVAGKRMELGAAGVPERPQGWVRHENVAPDWSALPQQTVIEIVHKACLEDPERPAIIIEDGPTLTRRQFLDSCQRFAGYLSGIIKPGDRVVVMLDNRLEFMIALFAIIANRGTLVSIPPTAMAFDAGHIVDDARPVGAIVGKLQLPVIETLRAEAPFLKHVLTIDGAEPDGLATYESAAEPLDFATVKCERDDIVTVYYTSGTTGAPKGCMLHHGWWLRVIDIDLRLFRRGWQDRQLCCLPFYYADPAIQLLTSLASRGTLIAMRRFSVSRFWDVVTKYDATELLSIASIPALLLKGEPGPVDRDHRVRLAIHAGLPKELHEELLQRYGFHWHNQYGSTEGGLMSRVPDHLADELVGTGTMGVEPPGVTIRLVDDNGNDVPDGEHGECLIGGPDLYAGYLNRAKVTAEANRGGWYHSGDIARRDERGLLYFVGRKKEIIRRSGENISAAEVEGVLRSHPKVVDAAVVAVPDQLRGEEVKAYVQLRPGQSLPPTEIIEFCKTNLAGFKLPRFIEYRDTDFVRTPSMRIQKQALIQAKADLRQGAWDRETGKFGE